jgi:hypothetical protein
MIITTYDINYKYGETVKIVPLFDIHLGNKLCDKVQLKRDLAALDWKSTYVFGGGDWLDSVIVSDRKRYRKSIDDSKGDDVIDEQIEEMYDIINPYKSHLIGVGSGNHEDTITLRCSTNPSKRLAKMLEVQCLGYSSLIRLRLSEKGARVRTVVIRSHHGWGGGSRTQGADLTKYSKDAGYWDCDVFTYGHVHKRQNDKVPRLGLCGEKFISKPKILMLCGTYLKTFTQSEDPSYSEKEGYPPCEIGLISVDIKPHNDWVKMNVVD